MTASTRAEQAAPHAPFLSLVFSACVSWMVWPLGSTRYLPIEDLPQHLAAIRVLHSFDDASYAFQSFFELQLGKTQYLAYYMLVDALSYVMDLELANRIVVIASVAAIPYALLYLLDALQRDRVLALF